MFLDAIVYEACLLKSDLHHIHLHCGGKDFDDIHQISQELYEELESEIDELSEIAIAEGCKVDNFSNVKSYIGDWEPEIGEVYDFDALISVIDNKARRYLQDLSTLSLRDPVNKRYINDIKYFWNKQINYKNMARQIPTNEQISMM